jgi:hypothetical protein
LMYMVSDTLGAGARPFEASSLGVTDRTVRVDIF